MVQKTLSAVLILAVVALLPARPAFARTREQKQAELAAKVKSGIAKLGVGEQTRVRITLWDKTKRTGYVREIAEDSFVVVDDRTEVATRIAYPDVAKVKGNNLSTGATIAIGAAVGVGVAFLILLLIYANNES